jgi:membrane-associated phospholipid phosphatase
VIPVFHPGKEDAWLQQLDLSLIGGNASLWLQRVTHPVLTDLLSACYLFFFPGLMLSWLHYFRRELPVLRAFIIGLFTVYGLGFIGYTFVPALGPYLDPAMVARFDMPLTGGWITQFNDHLVREGSNKVDVFPSLHCGVTAFILFFYHRHSPAAFRWVLVPTAGLWMATLYLRYHYFVDVVAGFLLAAAALWLVRPTHSQKSP